MVTRERTRRRTRDSSHHLMLLICLHPHWTFPPADNHTQQKQNFSFFFFKLAFKFPPWTLYNKGQLWAGNSYYPLCTPGLLEAGPQPSLSLCGVKSRCNPSRAILRAVSIALTAAVSDCTYLKTILLISAFTSCWVENASKGNSRRGAELNWMAPTLTCSGRQRAQGLSTESGHKHPWEKGRERLTTLPPAHLQIPVLVFL